MSQLAYICETLQNFQLKYKRLNTSEAHGFNVFSILLKSGDEVNLHSKFIYELLNPHGSHSQGSLFLDLFLKQLGLAIETQGMVASREKYNIDILLQSSSEAVIIENKIFTEDHSYQLSRYYQNMQWQGYRQPYLLYLTLFGHQPVEKSVRDHVISISYQHEIIAWLEEAIGAIRHISILKETLTQYLNLVKALTYQSHKEEFALDVKRFLLQENNLQTILSIEESIVEAKIEIQFNFWQTLLSHLIPHYAFTFYNANAEKGLKSSIRRYYNQQKNIKDYGIEYEVDDNLYFFVELRNNIYYGFYFYDDAKINQQQIVCLRQLNVPWNEISESVYWKYPYKRLDFKNFNEHIFDLIDTSKRQREVGAISNEILRMIDAYYQAKRGEENVV